MGLPGETLSMDIDALSTALAQQHEKDPFSGVVYIRERGETVFAQAWGDADKANGRPNRIDTRFGVASGSKTFTAVAICQLVERGLLSLDTRLTDCLDIRFPHVDPTVTLHHLLCHTSGIPDYFDEEVMDDYGALWAERPMYSIRKPADFLPLFQHLPQKFPPGQKFYYNNAAYIVLGLIIEQATGMAYTDYVQQAIFAPCGMADSGFYEADRLPANTAYGYIRCDDGGWRTNVFAVPIVGGPDGGVFVTAPDMGRFWDNLRNHTLLSADMTARLLTHHVDVTEGFDNAYGYGIWLQTTNATVDLYHAEGGDPGVAFLSGVVPTRDLDFTVLGNTDDPTWPIAKLVMAAVK